ncbi:hypothetical protein [Paenibacillus sp. GCM10027626]|uniref:hypothetical protein n=1 Tax=Paenibacillus sp. GCM10027626 TaxID=3273411 RepID=UPI0036257531
MCERNDVTNGAAATVNDLLPQKPATVSHADIRSVIWSKPGSFGVSRTHDPLFAEFASISRRLQANNGTTVREPAVLARLFTDNGTTFRVRPASTAHTSIL